MLTGRAQDCPSLGAPDGLGSSGGHSSPPLPEPPMQTHLGPEVALGAFTAPVFLSSKVATSKYGVGEGRGESRGKGEIKIKQGPKYFYSF